MSIQQIGGGMPNAVQGAAGKFFLPGASEFADGLRLGEIIKGKVLRQYEGNRYLVSFDGQERVVDSNVPLQTSELIHGRVIAVGEHVELQRVYPSEAGLAGGAQDGVSGIDANSRVLGRAEEVLNQLLSRYNVRLNQEDASALTNAVRRADDGNAMTLAGAMISKLGLKQAPELLWPVYNALIRRTDAALVPVTNEAWRVDGIPAHAASISPMLMRQISEAIDRTVNQSANEGSESATQTTGTDMTIDVAAQPMLVPVKQISDEDESKQPKHDPLAFWLLNAQRDGTVAHRLGTLPLLLGDQLVEVEMSFFEQRRDAEQKLEAKHRKIVFSLQMENLGRIEVMARLVGEHVSVQVATQDGEKTAAVARYVEQLKSLLQGVGWTVDEVVYETRQMDSYNGVVRSVVEHVASQDSLNRLI